MDEEDAEEERQCVVGIGDACVYDRGHFIGCGVVMQNALGLCMCRWW